MIDLYFSDFVNIELFKPFWRTFLRNGFIDGYGFWAEWGGLR